VTAFLNARFTGEERHVGGWRRSPPWKRTADATLPIADRGVRIQGINPQFEIRNSNPETEWTMTKPT